MRLYFLLLCILSISLSPCASQRMDFDFYDSTGEKYNSLTFQEQLFDDNQRLKLVLIETNRPDNMKYQKQLKILNGLPAESLNLIYVTSSPVFEDKAGYHTSLSTARKLSGDHDGFQVSLLSSKGKILKRSGEVLSGEEIIKIIREEEGHPPAP